MPFFSRGCREHNQESKPMKTSLRKIIRSLLLLCAFCFIPGFVRAADHGDAPGASNNASADLADTFFYLNPNDNTKAVLEMTVRGFIVPGEAVNMAIFDSDLTYEFRLEGTGDAIPDATISITFSPRTSSKTAQVATVTMTQGATTVFSFIAPATNPSLASDPPARVITTDPASGVGFFAGEVDDPFFFDIPAFSRFVASVLAGTPDPTVFDRGRDTFAGYNIMAIALDIPVALLPNNDGVVGVESLTFRADQHPVTLFGNLSTRGRVGTGEDVLIGGLIISGSEPKRVLVRGIGPSLGPSGVGDPLLDPTITVFNDQAQVVASNDDWMATQEAEITGTGLAPSDPKESALIASLQPGAYTAVVSGVGDTTGVALVEAYDLDTGALAGNGELRQIDRQGLPAINVALIPFARKDEYNSASPSDDAASRFAGDIVATLTALGTNDANIAILAGLAVTNGDLLRLDLNIANSGPGGGNNPEAAFPNGRRLADDTIDTILSLVTNQSGITDNVNANDVPLLDTFPFFALSQQPRAAGVIDDNTRN
jgi:hypothetical protein